MNKLVTPLGLAAVLFVIPCLSGCGVTATTNPLAAAAGLAKLQALGENPDIEDLAGALANDITAEELASMVNLGLGKDWTLDDANAAKDLLGEVLANTEALGNSGIDDPNATDEEVKDALSDAGIEATDHEIDLLRELLEAAGGAS